MKIADVKTWAVANPPPHRGGPYWVFLRLTTDNGIHGYGEVYGVPFGPRTVRRMIEDTVARHAIGADPFRIETMWRRVYSQGYGQHPDHALTGVLSGIEIACWDIVGKALDQPVYNLLGGRVHETLRSYTYLYPPHTGEADKDALAIADIFSDPEAGPRRAAEYAAMGFTAVKYDPVMPMGAFDPRQLSLEALDGAEKMTRNMREAIGGSCDLLIGTHGQPTASSAIALARRLEPWHPLWLEEPVPPENIAEMARVARATSIPVATGERLATKYEFAPLLQAQAAATIQPALGRVGGILEAKKIAGMAEAHYVSLAPHLYCGPVEAAANIQLGTCSPNFLIQESIERFDGFYADILKSPIVWQDGRIVPPTAPGIGVEIDEAVADANPYDGPLFPDMAPDPVWP